MEAVVVYMYILQLYSSLNAFVCCQRFHSCHDAALQALYCLKARAEYELLPGSMQVYIPSLHYVYEHQ